MNAEALEKFFKATDKMTAQYENRRLSEIRRDFSNILGLLRGPVNREYVVQLMEAMEERNALLQLKYEKDMKDIAEKLRREANEKKQKVSLQLAEAKAELESLRSKKKSLTLVEGEQGQAVDQYPSSPPPTPPAPRPSLPYGIERRYQSCGREYFFHAETEKTSYNLSDIIKMVEFAQNFGVHACCRRSTLRPRKVVNYKD